MFSVPASRIRPARAIVLGALVLAALVPATAAAKSAPETIRLPDGFQPEGIASGPGTSLFVGSIPTGAIWAGDARAGSGEVLVPAQAGRSAIGIKVDRRRRIFVAGGETGEAYVYDASTGANLARYRLLPEGMETFVNDVIVTKNAAYFTDSINQQLYVVPLGPHGALPDQDEVRTLPLSGDLVFGPGFNANGIAAAKGGRVLVLVQSSTGRLFTVDPGSGHTREIDLGGEALTDGDGLLLRGRTLYVVRNQLNRIAVVHLKGGLTSGKVVAELVDPDFDVPTTIAFTAGNLYAVNARFNTPPTPTTRYDIVSVG